MITIDGSRGEGGGQVLRTALGLSLVTGRPFAINRIRAGRRKPGLMRQHLTAVNAAAQVGSAQVEGNRPGSTELVFTPRAIQGGDYSFAVGTAGSCTLVFQTVLPAMLVAGEPSRVRLSGGTHNPFAPPFDFLDLAFLPLLRRMGVRIQAELEQPGFFPAGGGIFSVEVTPPESLQRIELLERGHRVRRLARARCALLPARVGQRELQALAGQLSLPRECLELETIDRCAGPGNVLTLELEYENLTEVFTGFGTRGVPAERVAAELADQAKGYLKTAAPVGPHLADQLLIPMAMAGGGRFRTVGPTRHTRTNADVVALFLEREILIEPEAERTWIVTIR